MVTVYAYKKEPNKDENYYEYLGLSTDTKPQDKKVAVNSMFLELDTGDFYYLKSQAAESKTVLFEEQSFVGVYESGNHSYVCEFYADPFDNDNICVKFDGIKYECSRSGDPGFNTYGAPWDSITGTFDWGTYPFQIEADTALPDEHTVYVSVADDNEHTIEVYTESSTPAVWEKIGSGASPSGDDAVVGTAIVGTSKVGKGEEPQPTYEKIYELTFSDWQDDGDGSYFTDINGSSAPSEIFPNTVTVDWDGVRYKDLEIVGGYQWGAPWDYEQNAYDFSVYPFSFQLYDVGGGSLELHLVANSDAEHTFEVYVEDDD